MAPPLTAVINACVTQSSDIWFPNPERLPHDDGNTPYFFIGWWCVSTENIDIEPFTHRNMPNDETNFQLQTPTGASRTTALAFKKTDSGVFSPLYSRNQTLSMSSWWRASGSTISLGYVPSSTLNLDKEGNDNKRHSRCLEERRCPSRDTQRACRQCCDMDANQQNSLSEALLYNVGESTPGRTRFEKVYDFKLWTV